MSRKAKDSLKKLTNKWYKKLRQSGFEDIEWYNPQTGSGQNTPYLKNSALNIRDRYNKFTETHYRLMQNYLTHATSLSKKDEFILTNYINGVNFREIIRLCRIKGNGYGYTAGKASLSLFSLHHIIKRHIKIAYEWNKTDVEGLSYEGIDSAFQSDPYIESEVLRAGSEQQEE